MNLSTSSLFSQLLSLNNRSRFAKLIRATGSERRTKGFASWDHFVAMLFHQLLGTVALHAPGKKFRFKSKLDSLDSSVIELCASMSDWANFRATKGAAKLHLLLDHDDPFQKTPAADPKTASKKGSQKRGQTIIFAISSFSFRSVPVRVSISLASLLT